MINWITGELVEFWQTNKKFFVLINCQGLGYEIQILESFYLKLKTKILPNKNITLWIKHIKKEDTDLLFGFISKDQKNFFIEILNIRGVGSQIGMSLLNKFSNTELINAINTQNKKLISSVPGVGQKMTERLILELKNKFTKEFIIDEGKTVLINNTEINNMIADLELTLHSLDYTKKEIKTIMPIVIKDAKKIESSTKKEKNITFENLLELAMNFLDNESSKIVR